MTVRDFVETGNGYERFQLYLFGNGFLHVLLVEILLALFSYGPHNI